MCTELLKSMERNETGANDADIRRCWFIMETIYSIFACWIDRLYKICGGGRGGNYSYLATIICGSEADRRRDICPGLLLFFQSTTGRYFSSLIFFFFFFIAKTVEKCLHIFNNKSCVIGSISKIWITGWIYGWITYRVCNPPRAQHG